MQARRTTRLSVLLTAALVCGLAISDAKAMYRLQAASECDLVFRGTEMQGYAGQSIANVGDVNDDGYPDMAIGVPGGNKVYIFLGRPFGRAIIDLTPTSLEVGLIVIHCDLLGDRFGWSVSPGGDFNGDGVGDIVIGWPGAEYAGFDTGAAALVLGRRTWRSDGARITIAVSSLNGPSGFVIRGTQAGSQAGACVAGGGDFNHDLLDDLVIAAPLAGDPSKQDLGRFYVVLGRSVIPASMPLDPLTGNGFEIRCPAGGALDPNTSSTVCAWPGDVNGDGFDDLLLGTPIYDLAGYTDVGVAWVLFGDAAPSTQPIDLLDIPRSAPGIRIWIDPVSGFNSRTGFCVAGVGDVDRNGIADFAIGIPNGQWMGPVGGMVAVVPGRPAFPANIDLLSLQYSFWIVNDLATAEDQFGSSIAAAGDPNNDGIADIVIGAPGSTGRDESTWAAGQAYVIYSEPTTSSVFFSQAGNRVVRIVGVFGSQQARKPGDLFGWSVCGPGDLNRDGVDDIAIGSPLSRSMFGAPTDMGFVFCLFFEPPRMRAVYLSDPNGNRQGDPGERINVVLNMPVFVQPSLVSDLFYVANSGRLGWNSSIAQLRPGSNRMQIVLGSLASDLLAPGPGTALDFNATGPRNRVVSARQGVNPMDGAVIGVNDTAVDLRLPLRATSATIGAASGGTVTVPPDTDANYAGHEIHFPAGSLAGDATVELRQAPDPPGDFGLGSAVWLTASRAFTSARLTIGYRDDDLPPSISEGQMRVFRFGWTGYSLVPGIQTVDAVNNKITVNISGLGQVAAGSGEGQAEANGYSYGYGGLPIETVDERQASMRPEGAAPPGIEAQIGLTPQPGSTAYLTLTPGPESIYTQHKLVFHDYVTSSPGSVRVKIRTAALAERTYTVPIIGSQYFPSRSDAIFTVETVDATSQPVALTAPVDITVDYKPSGNPKGYSDVIDFNQNAGDWRKMRIVRSVQNPSTYVPNFVFINAAQQVNDTDSTVTTSAYRNLTDSQGKATYGVVINSSPADATHWSLYR